MDILLVDDEPFVIEQLHYLISDYYPHWNISSAIDGSQALNKMGEQEFQLAVVDIELPGKSGLELSKSMKALNPYMTIVILSAHQDFDYARQSIQIGVADYLTKPIIEKELLELLKKYAGNYDYSDIVLNAIQYIKQNYNEKITLSDLAESIHVNPSYLSRKFHDEVGKKYSDYILDYRMDIAKQMLVQNRSDSVSIIAENCGFRSLHYFSTTFKKWTGQTPKEFREDGTKSS